MAIHTSFSQENGRSDKIDGIQYLRFLCASLVVISHENGFLEFPEYFGKAPLPSLHLASLFAVAAFFSISGYIIAVCSLDAALQPRHSLSVFLGRRALRILPFFWLCTLFYNGLSWAGSGHASGATLLRTLVLWPLGELRPNVAWSLRHELIFYLLFATCLLPARQMARRGPGFRWLFIVAWCLAPLLFAPLLWGKGWANPAMDNDLYELMRFFLAGGESGANLQFGAGLLAGWVQLRRPHWLSRLPSLTLWHLAALFAVCAAMAQMTAIPTGFLRVLLWSVLALIVIVAGLRITPRRGLADRVALAVGNSSFSLYLMHNTVMLILLTLSMRWHLRLHGGVELGAYLLLCIILSVAACHALYLFCEKPLIRHAQARFRQRPIATRA